LAIALHRLRFHHSIAHAEVAPSETVGSIPDSDEEFVDIDSFAGLLHHHLLRLGVRHHLKETYLDMPNFEKWHSSSL